MQIREEKNRNHSCKYGRYNNYFMSFVFHRQCFFLIYRQNNDGCCPFNLYATSSIIQALTLFCISLALRRIIKHENKRIKMKTKNKKTTMCCVHDCAAVLNAHNACVFITHARTHAHEYEQQVKVTM